MTEPPETTGRHVRRGTFTLRELLFVMVVIAIGSAVAHAYPRFVFEIVAAGVVVVTFALVVTRPDPLRFFLRYINPLLAVLVLVICLMAGTTNLSGSDWEYHGFFKESIPTYFVAKGIFCSTILFVVGKLVERVIERLV